jgi:hypothetical protein
MCTFIDVIGLLWYEMARLLPKYIVLAILLMPIELPSHTSKMAFTFDFG